jgi:hypothetical protein
LGASLSSPRATVPAVGGRYTWGYVGPDAIDEGDDPADVGAGVNPGRPDGDDDDAP